MKTGFTQGFGAEGCPCNPNDLQLSSCPVISYTLRQHSTGLRQGPGRSIGYCRLHFLGVTASQISGLEA